MSHYLYFFLVPPDPLVIFDETGKRRASVVGPYLVGDSIHLVCDAFGGKLLPLKHGSLLLQKMGLLRKLLSRIVIYEVASHKLDQQQSM